MSIAKTTQILSIQSHVTHGYVGNKAAVFPLQLHGFDVDAINTVSLSNHSGYPIIKGHRMDVQEFMTIMDGLRANHFLQGYQYILSGYVNNPQVIAELIKVVQEICELREKAAEANPSDAELQAKVKYICDPVMGDDGRLYCAEEVITEYQNLVGLADVVTPNFFEASLLSGIEVVDLASACQAADWFHAKGTPAVVVKSFPVPNDPEKLQFLLSLKEASASKPVRYTGLVKFYPGRYTGTGDVFAASFLAFSHTHPPEVAVGMAMGVLQDLILATQEAGGVGEASLNARELRVTHSMENLLHPKTKVEVRRL